MGQKASFTTHYLPLSAGWLRRSGTVWREEMNKRIKTGINVHSNCFLIRWSRTENHHHLPMWSQFFFLNWFLTNQRWNDLVLCGKTLWTISFKSHLAWNECHDHIHSQRIFFLASQKTKRSCFNWEEMEKTNRKSNHIKKISSLCPIKNFCCCLKFFAPYTNQMIV